VRYLATHVLTLWTNDPKRAASAARAGVDRVGLDLETLGKVDRQRGLDTWISPHKLQDIDVIGPEIAPATLFVRCNPLHPGSRLEIEALIDRGVRVIMLPNFTNSETVELFLDIVAGRARVVPLIERLAATSLISALAALGIDEVHIGLNDLSIESSIRNRLALLASPLLDAIAAGARANNVRFGVGGLARAMDEDLPIASDLVYAQHARLGATGALIARSFFVPGMSSQDFATEIAKMRERLRFWFAAPPTAIEGARVELCSRVKTLGQGQ